MSAANIILSGSVILGDAFNLRCKIRTGWRRIMISISLSHLATPKIANRSRNIEVNDIINVKIINLPLRDCVLQAKSLPHFGKLTQSNEVVASLGRREPPRRCGWIIYTIQGHGFLFLGRNLPCAVHFSSLESSLLM